jgi:hypothetical protein
MSDNGKTNGTLPGIEEVPHIDILIRFYPTMPEGKNIQLMVPQEFQTFAVAGLLEVAKQAYMDVRKQMASESRIVIPAMGVTPKVS